MPRPAQLEPLAFSDRQWRTINPNQALTGFHCSAQTSTNRVLCKGDVGYIIIMLNVPSQGKGHHPDEKAADWVRMGSDQALTRSIRPNISPGNENWCLAALNGEWTEPYRRSALPTC